MQQSWKRLTPAGCMERFRVACGRDVLFVSRWRSIPERAFPAQDMGDHSTIFNGIQTMRHHDVPWKTAQDVVPRMPLAGAIAGTWTSVEVRSSLSRSRHPVRAGGCQLKPAGQENDAVREHVVPGRADCHC